MDDRSLSDELDRVSRYLRAITALLAVLVVLVGFDVFTRLVDPGIGSLLLYGSVVFLVGLLGYALYTLSTIDADRETTAD